MTRAPENTPPDFVFAPPEPQSLPVTGGAPARLFPVRRIFCVARNYASHAREMGHAPAQAATDAPVFFLKPATALAQNGAIIPYPPATQDLQHEVELVVALGAPCKNATAATAQQAVFGYAVGLDLTRRDLQKAAKDKGNPWDMAKVFDGAAPCGAITPATDTGKDFLGKDFLGEDSAAGIRLSVNGALRQEASLRDMIWPAAELLAHLSRLLLLLPGDLLFTGTPAGVGSLAPGDRVEAAIDGLQPLRIAIADRA